MSTGVWGRAVNFPNLAVLIRAGGGSSPIVAVQMPGRVSRLGKDYAIVHDFLDQFDEGLKKKAQERWKQYVSSHWKQTLMDRDGTITTRGWKHA